MTKINIFENFDENRDARIFFTKIKFLENIDQNLYFLTILTKIETFENFDQNGVFRKFQNSRFSKIWTKNEIFRKFLIKSSFYEDLDLN